MKKLSSIINAKRSVDSKVQFQLSFFLLERQRRDCRGCSRNAVCSLESSRRFTDHRAGPFSCSFWYSATHPWAYFSVGPAAQGPDSIYVFRCGGHSLISLFFMHFFRGGVPASFQEQQCLRKNVQAQNKFRIRKELLTRISDENHKLYEKLQRRKPICNLKKFSDDFRFHQSLVRRISKFPPTLNNTKIIQSLTSKYETNTEDELKSLQTQLLPNPTLKAGLILKSLDFRSQAKNLHSSIVCKKDWPESNH